MSLIDLFTHELQQPSPAPERLALAIAGIGHPHLDVNHALTTVDNLAETVRRSLFAKPAGQARAEHFLHLFNQELGFTGNRDHYYDPANSYLNEVVERRTGLPIMLSLLCMAIGRRVGVHVVGVGFPGHFMARYEDELGAWLLDPFHGEVVAPSAAEHYLGELLQRPVTLAPAVYAAVGPAALAQRILNNLRNVYLSRGDYGMNGRVLDYLLILLPAEAEFWQERGLMHFHTDQWDAAARDLHRYFFLHGQNLLALGQEGYADETQSNLNEQDAHLLNILRQIEIKRRRVN